MARMSPQVVARIARSYGIDPRIFVNQIRQESGFRTDARSPAGAQGIAQIVYRYHPDAPPPSDPLGQLRWAAQHMRSLVNKYGNYQDALSVYNSGRPFSRGRSISETNNYVRSIMGGNITASPNVSGAGTQTFPASNGGGRSGSRDSLLKWIMANNTSYMQKGRITDTAPPQEGADSTMLPVGGDEMTPTDPLNMGGNKLANAAKLATKLGLRVTEYEPYGRVNRVHVPNSMHYGGRAFDASGSPAAMARLFDILQRTRPTELFYDPRGAIKRGQRIGAIGGHGDHIHVGY